jgi:hypothetical protein
LSKALTLKLEGRGSRDMQRQQTRQHEQQEGERKKEKDRKKERERGGGTDIIDTKRFRVVI